MIRLKYARASLIHCNGVSPPCRDRARPRYSAASAAAKLVAGVPRALVAAAVLFLCSDRKNPGAGAGVDMRTCVGLCPLPSPEEMIAPSISQSRESIFRERSTVVKFRAARSGWCYTKFSMGLPPALAVVRWRSSSVGPRKGKASRCPTCLRRWGTVTNRAPDTARLAGWPKTFWPNFWPLVGIFSLACQPVGAKSTQHAAAAALLMQYVVLARWAGSRVHLAADRGHE